MLWRFLIDQAMFGGSESGTERRLVRTLVFSATILAAFLLSQLDSLQSSGRGPNWCPFTSAPSSMWSVVSKRAPSAQFAEQREAVIGRRSAMLRMPLACSCDYHKEKKLGVLK